MSTDPNRPFDGQPHTDDGIRGKTEIQGVRFRDLCDCILKAFVHAAAFSVLNEKELYEKVENNTICSQDLYPLNLSKMSPVALVQNISCEVEKFMGIFPNLEETIPSTPDESQNDAWRDFTIEELGQLVHLLVKRAHHRSSQAECLKDLEDARNYWRMIGSRIDFLEKKQ